jgi:hypothetical protein
MTTSPVSLWMNEPIDVTRMLRILDQPSGDPAFRHGVTFVETTTAMLRDLIVSGHKKAKDVEWNRYFIDIGQAMLNTLSKDFDEPKFVEMLLAKHRRYGLKSLTAWREVGVLTRIDQKIARLLNMAERAGQNMAHDVGDETVYDTMVDIVGYCVIGLHMAEQLPKL